MPIFEQKKVHLSILIRIVSTLLSPRINLLEEDNPKPGEEGVDDHQGHAEAHPACIRQGGNSLAIGAGKVIIAFII